MKPSLFTILAAAAIAMAQVYAARLGVSHRSLLQYNDTGEHHLKNP
jgi:hypothetical protein